MGVEIQVLIYSASFLRSFDPVAKKTMTRVYQDTRATI